MPAILRSVADKADEGSCNPYNLLTTSRLLADLQRLDHASFWAEVYLAMMLTDTLCNMNHHCANGPDSVDRLDHEIATTIVQATVGKRGRGPGLALRAESRLLHACLQPAFFSGILPAGMQTQHMSGCAVGRGADGNDARTHIACNAPALFIPTMLTTLAAFAACAQVQGPGPGLDAGGDTGIAEAPFDPAGEPATEGPDEAIDATPDGTDPPFDYLGDCGPGLAWCSGACVDIYEDEANCGYCNHECSAGSNAVAVCEMGICSTNCLPGWADPGDDGDCESACVPTSATEICNGIDDDCNGIRDDGFACRMGQPVSCFTTCSSLGSATCGSDCEIPGPAGCSPPVEVCNGADDDCDGSCDNGFECCWGQREPCVTACDTSGMRTCSSCSWGECEPPMEVCNGTDDDCDGLTDEGYEAYQCPLTSAVFADPASCDAACWRTEDCAAHVDTFGSMTFRDCDYEGTCYPNYDVGRIEASGSNINFYSTGGWMGSYNLVGSVTISGATASGAITFRDCDYEGTCYPNYNVDRIEASGSSIGFYSTAGWMGSYNLVGSVTLTPTVPVCPIDSALPCTGSPSTCTLTSSCTTITDC